MRHQLIPWLTLVAATTGGLSAQGNGKLIQYLDTLPKQAVSIAERQDLVAMRQEEKLARDVYQVLHLVWQQPIFANIAQAEQSHMNLVKRMLDKYAIPDPITSDAWGVYQDPVFTWLAVQLVQFGLHSPAHALAVGAYIEDLDIFDLNAALNRTDNRDIGTVFQNLVRGSRNHLRSFYGQLAGQDLYYPGFVLTGAEIQRIVNAPRENHPVDENGKPL